jgi:hypothetical protein
MMTIELILKYKLTINNYVRPLAFLSEALGVAGMAPGVPLTLPGVPLILPGVPALVPSAVNGRGVPPPISLSDPVESRPSCSHKNNKSYFFYESHFHLLLKKWLNLFL